ncbi:hypothetical protein H5410_051594 [Solanum commersonii]|uniref:Uncharacterized protein n=1 Tax=Solanum commersonii TaxID=4109 RepID=A0A9J5WZY8_SOLCO|nr:hypothetical protein H5410_051594 [Solanum commersonii]
MYRVQYWTSRFFSYAGRAQLIKRGLVLHSGVHHPKKGCQIYIKTLYKTCLWTGGEDTWNKAAISKFMWILTPQASWTVRKILQAHKDLETIGLIEEYVKQIDKFSIKQLYKALRGNYRKNRLLTRDKLVAWGCVEDVHCILCETMDENHNHLFFRYMFLFPVLSWQNIHREARGWEEETILVNTYYKGKQSRAVVYRMTMIVRVCLILPERNQQIFQKTIRTPSMLAKQVVQEVHVQCLWLQR